MAVMRVVLVRQCQGGVGGGGDEPGGRDWSKWLLENCAYGHLAEAPGGGWPWILLVGVVGVGYLQLQLQLSLLWAFLLLFVHLSVA